MGRIRTIYPQHRQNRSKGVRARRCQKEPWHPTFREGAESEMPGISQSYIGESELKVSATAFQLPSGCLA